MDTDSARLLEQIRGDRAAHKLVHDRDDRWYLFAFETDPPEVTDVRKDVAGRLLDAGWIEDMGDDARIDLPGVGYHVFGITEEGERALEGSDG